MSEKTYEIKKEPVKINGKDIVKYNIYYYEYDELFLKEFHSYDGQDGDIRCGFVPRG